VPDRHGACVGAHHLSRKLKALGHDALLMPAKYVRPYSKGQKNDFRDAEAIAEAVQRPTAARGSRTADRNWHWTWLEPSSLECPSARSLETCAKVDSPPLLGCFLLVHDVLLLP
jgi:hypothetical protein